MIFKYCKVQHFEKCSSVLSPEFLRFQNNQTKQNESFVHSCIYEAAETIFDRQYCWLASVTGLP